MILVAGLAAVAAVSWRNGWLGFTSHAPAAATQIPSSLPKNGVSLFAGGIVLTRWKRTPPKAMSKSEAVAAALHYADKAKSFRRTALQADLTSAPIDHLPVWVVTFTSPKPVDVSAGLTSVYVTHYSVAVNAVTGKFVRGFFEP